MVHLNGRGRTTQMTLPSQKFSAWTESVFGSQNDDGTELRTLQPPICCLDIFTLTLSVHPTWTASRLFSLIRQTAPHLYQKRNGHCLVQSMAMALKTMMFTNHRSLRCVHSLRFLNMRTIFGQPPV